MSIKVCVILSPPEGPANLGRALRPGPGDDRVWIVAQRHAGGADLEALAECLEEISAHPVTRLRSEAVPLHGGIFCLLGADCEARVEGHRLVPGSAAFDLDAFLASLSSFGEKAAVSVLPGRELPGAGLAGLKALQAAGARVFSAREDVDAGAWSARLAEGGVRCEPLPLNELFNPPETVVAGPQKRLLIADDEPTVRGLLGELCRLRGFACEYAGDGLDVMRLLRKGDYAGVVLDIHMPELDGIQTLKRLQAEYPGLPVLVVTADPDPAVLEGAKAMGVPVLGKDFKTEQFQRALEIFRARV